MGMAISRQCCGPRASSIDKTEALQVYDQAQQPQTNALQLELEPRPMKTKPRSPCIIDHLSYPHIIDAILEHRESWLPMASTCRHYHRRLMPQVFRHVVVMLERKPMRVKSRRARLRTALAPRFLIVDSHQPKSSISQIVHFTGRLNNDVRALDVVGRRNWFKDQALCERFQRLAISLPVETIRFVGAHPLECDEALPPFRAKTYVFLEPRYSSSLYGTLFRGMPEECSKIVTHVDFDPKLNKLRGIHAPTWTSALNRTWVLRRGGGIAALDQQYSVPEECLNRLADCVSQSLGSSWIHFAAPYASHPGNVLPKRIIVDFHILQNVVSEQEFRDRVRRDFVEGMAMTVAWGGDPAMWTGISVDEVMKWLIFLTRDEYTALIGREQAAVELEVGYDWKLMARQ